MFCFWIHWRAFSHFSAISEGVYIDFFFFFLDFLDFFEALTFLGDLSDFFFFFFLGDSSSPSLWSITTLSVLGDFFFGVLYLGGVSPCFLCKLMVAA